MNPQLSCPHSCVLFVSGMTQRSQCEIMTSIFICDIIWQNIHGYKIYCGVFFFKNNSYNCFICLTFPGRTRASGQSLAQTACSGSVFTYRQTHSGQRWVLLSGYWKPNSVYMSVTWILQQKAIINILSTSLLKYWHPYWDGELFVSVDQASSTARWVRPDRWWQLQETVPTTGRRSKKLMLALLW